jgi:hypothetical protein
MVHGGVHGRELGRDHPGRRRRKAPSTMLQNGLLRAVPSVVSVLSDPRSA